MAHQISETPQPLTESSYWNSVWASSQPEAVIYAAPGRIRQLAEGIFGPERLKRYVEGCEYHVWNNVLPRFVKPDRHGRVLEIGSAPGNQLLRFHVQFQHVPYGVEYTAAGAEANRKKFFANGIDPSQVYEADAFAPEFLAGHFEEFDTVMSWGLIEHFTDPVPAIDAHIDLLKPGGLLIVSIPNLTGFNRWQVERWAPESLPLHNLDIMNPDRFRDLFDRPELDRLLCAPVGGIHVLMADTGGPIRPGLLSLLRKTSVVTNILQSWFGVPENPKWSSHLIYIGRKRLA